MTTLILAINYHSEPDALRLAADLLGQQGAESLVLAVVDNTAHLRPAPHLAALAERDPRVRYLVPGENLGYFGGAAWGRQRLLAEGLHPEWIVITNTDIRIPDRRFFDRLSSIRDVAVLAPSILSGLSDRDQNPFLARRPSARRMRFYKWLFASYRGLVAWDLAARAKKWWQRRSPPPVFTPGPIYAPHGAFLLIHRSYFAAGAGIEPGTFLFNEEFLVAESCRQRGLAVRYDPSFEVQHAEHTSTSPIANRVIADHIARAAAWAADTYFRKEL